MKIKTVDITAKEWFDKINGNSYFSAQVTINYGMKTEKSFSIPFQYGYGSHYLDIAMRELRERKFITDAGAYSSGVREAIWSYCQRKNIILRFSKYENCLKREVVSWGGE